MTAYRDALVGAMPWYDDAHPDYSELDALIVKHDVENGGRHMSTTRLALALNELAAALLELVDEPAVAPTPLAAAFVQAAPLERTDAGVCPVHHVPWRTTKRDGTQAKRAFCTEKTNGEFCDERGPWLNR